MKRLISLLLLFAISMSLLTACGSESISQDKTVYTDYTDSIMGLMIKLPEKELADWTVLYGPFDQSVDRGEYAPVDGSYLCFMPSKSTAILFNIEYYDAVKWDGWIKAGHTADELTGTPNSEEIGRKDGMVYVYSRPESDETGMDSETKKTYERILNMLPTIRNSITLLTRGAANTGSFPSFSTTDLEGNPVNDLSFADYKITMVNIWGTFCGPCIEEMPDLEALSKSLPAGTRLIGLVSDATDEKHRALALKILDENGATYKNLIPDDALAEYVNSYVTGVPTTLFIDTKGQIVGDAIVGSVSEEDYLNAITSRLDELGSN